MTGSGEHPVLAADVVLLAEARDALADTSMHFAMKGRERPLTPILNATSYLDLMGAVVVGWLLMEQAVIAWPKLEAIPLVPGVRGSSPGPHPRSRTSERQ